jgi:hypothetical protein
LPWLSQAGSICGLSEEARSVTALLHALEILGRLGVAGLIAWEI